MVCFGINTKSAFLQIKLHMNKKTASLFFYLSNALSLSRAFLAFLFLLESPTARATAVILAMVTDSVDGYLARKAHSTSRFGAIIDPLMDKFFVYFALTILFMEQRIALWEWIAFTSRDFALFLFGGYLWIKSRLKTYEVQSIILGKISTALQFIFLILLSLKIPIPSLSFAVFIPLAVTALIELLFSLNAKTP